MQTTEQNPEIGVDKDGTKIIKINQEPYREHEHQPHHEEQ